LEPNLFRYVWQKSKREQIIVLLVILASIPFYFVSFDIPKRIVNDAIQGRAFRDGKTTATLFDLTLPLPDFLGGSYTVSKGFELPQVEYLFALSFVFLALVLINGAFKYVINVEKGVLGERMLRRLRYDLFVQLLRFKPEDIRAVKPAEVAGMIKDEVEPIGGFVGDAFIQPVFLIVQAATAVVFIMMQSVWLGSLAVLIVALQALIIPALRREQLRLGRERQLASRQLAGRIGEIVDVAPALQGHGAVSFMQSDIAGRLGRLFDIRFALYRRKFAVKFLNNLLAQITPFFFYAVGGYFALKGRLDLGQLIAVIAAYRDLPPPIKELIDWDQQRADVIIKYEQVINQFSPTEVLKIDDEKVAAITGPVDQITITQLLVTDNRGQTLLEPLTLTVPPGSCSVLAGAPGSGRDVLGRVLGRQIMGYSGKVDIGPVELSRLAARSASHLIGYAGHEIEIIQGSLRENLVLSLQRRKPTQLFDREMDAGERRRVIESIRSGNSPLRFEADWIDYAAAGIEGEEQVDLAIREILAVLGVEKEVYELGLAGRILQMGRPAGERQRLEKALIDAREAVAEELKAARLTGLVETFDPLRYNPNATIGENLMFGSTKSDRLSHDNFLADPFGRSILQAEGLIGPLVEIGSHIVTNVVEVFTGLPPGHQLFERYAFSRTIDFERMIDMSESLARQDARSSLDAQTEQQLVAIALGYIEPRHRYNLIDDTFRRRILRARASFRAYLPQDYVQDIYFYNVTQPIFGATVRDNLLFGRIGYGVADSTARVSKVIKKALTRSGLDGEVYRLGLDAETGNKGRHLPARLRFAVPLVRALIKHPEIYILDIEALLATTPEALPLVARLKAHCAGKTLFLLLADAQLADESDLVISFTGAHGTVTIPDTHDSEPAMIRHEPAAPAMQKQDTGAVS
jgi:putative ABC transport system ATP-binding protein